VLGTAAAGAVPALSGAAGTLAGVDLDVVDISARLSPATTQLAIAAATTDDRFYLGGLVTSIALPPLPDAAPPVDATTFDTGAATPDGAPDTGSADGGSGAGPDAPVDAAASSDAAPGDGALTDADGGAGDGTKPEAGADAPTGNSVRTVLGGSGCACRVASTSEGGALPAAALAWLAAAAIRRRSRTRAGSAPGRARTP
jgi:MYXO-CTERM domain-containing protein